MWCFAHAEAGKLLVADRAVTLLEVLVGFNVYDYLRSSSTPYQTTYAEPPLAISDH